MTIRSLTPAVLDVSIRKDYVELRDGAGAQTSVLTLKKNDYGLWQLVWPHGTKAAEFLAAAQASGEDLGRYGCVFRQPGTDIVVASGPLTTVINSEGTRNGVAGDAVSAWGVTDLTHLRERITFPDPTTDIPVTTGAIGPEFRRNHFHVPSAATDLGWATIGATLTRADEDMGDDDEGYRFRLVTVGESAADRSATTASPAQWATAAPGQRWALSALIRSDTSNTFFVLAVEFLTSAGGRTGIFYGAPGSGSDRDEIITTPAPAGTAYARAVFSVRGSAEGAPAGPDRAIEFDHVMLEQTDVGQLDYFDGDTEDRGLVAYEWTGTPGSSPSIARRGPAHAWSTFTWDRTGPAETVALDLVRANLGAEALARRRLPCTLIVPPSLGRGPQVSVGIPANKNVLEVVQQMMALAGLVVDLLQTGPGELTLVVREPVRRGIVWMAGEGGTAVGVSIKTQRRPKTDIINSGSGDDATTAYVRRVAPDPVLGPFSEVREEFIKGSGDDAAELSGEADEELIEDGPEYGLDVEPHPDARWRVGIDYEVGDYHIGVVGGADFEVPVTSVLLRHEEGTLTEEPSVAFEDDTSLEPLIRRLFKRIRRLGG